MNTAIILAAGVGQRMRNSGLPKQFLSLFGKPIVAYTLEKFQQMEEIDRIVIVCREGYTERMREVVRDYHIHKAERMIIGGESRQSSLRKGLDEARRLGGETDIVVIHDGVRPLVRSTSIRENIRIAAAHGAAMTVHPVTESVVVSASLKVGLQAFKKRADTYSLTSPQSFRLGEVLQAYMDMEADFGKGESGDIPLLDAAMVYAHYIHDVAIVKETGSNIKITTPEDYYYLKAMIEMEENRVIFGL